MRRERYNARSCAIRASVGLALVSWITLAAGAVLLFCQRHATRAEKQGRPREWLRDLDICRKAVIMEQNRLEVTPSELRFRFELKRAIAATMTLTNKGGAPTAFKVKTTAPKKYCVRPSSGIVEAGRTMVVNVTMQSQRAMPDDSEFENCRDKFLVQSVMCDPGLDSLTPELFDKTKNPTGIQEHRMRVRLERPTTSVGDMAEKGEGNAANGLAEANSSPASATAAVVAQMPQEASVEQTNELIAERNKLKQELQEIADEKANLVQQVRELKLGDHGPDGSSMGKPADPGTAAAPQLNIVVVLLVSIIAFIAGHWLSQ